MFEEDVSKEFAPYTRLYQEYITRVATRRNGTPETNGEQIVWQFPNGYGASLSNTNGNIELAVMREDDQGRWRLCYTTPVTPDVVIVAGEEKCGSLLKEILALDSVRWDFENER